MPDYPARHRQPVNPEPVRSEMTLPPMLRVSLSTALEELDLSAGDLARLCDVPSATALRWLSGVEPIPMSVIRMCGLLVQIHRLDFPSDGEVDDAPRTVPPKMTKLEATPEILTLLLEELELPLEDFARLCKTPPEVMRQWLAGLQPFPTSLIGVCARMLRLHRANKRSWLRTGKIDPTLQRLIYLENQVAANQDLIDFLIECLGPEIRKLASDFELAAAGEFDMATARANARKHASAKRTGTAVRRRWVSQSAAASDRPVVRRRRRRPRRQPAEAVVPPQVTAPPQVVQPEQVAVPPQVTQPEQVYRRRRVPEQAVAPPPPPPQAAATPQAAAPDEVTQPSQAVAPAEIVRRHRVPPQAAVPLPVIAPEQAAAPQPAPVPQYRERLRLISAGLPKDPPPTAATSPFGSTEPIVYRRRRRVAPPDGSTEPFIRRRRRVAPPDEPA
jgi:hypothetical protein